MDSAVNFDSAPADPVVDFDSAPHDPISNFDSAPADDNFANSKTNTVLAALADNPISKGVGSVVGGLANSGVNAITGIGDVNPLKTISQAYHTAGSDIESAHQANPATFAITKAADETLPFLATGGLSAVPRIAANAAIGGTESAMNGGNAKEILGNAAVSGLLPEAISRYGGPAIAKLGTKMAGGDNTITQGMKNLVKGGAGLGATVAATHVGIPPIIADSLFGIYGTKEALGGAGQVAGNVLATKAAQQTPYVQAIQNLINANNKDNDE